MFGRIRYKTYRLLAFEPEYATAAENVPVTPAKNHQTEGALRYFTSAPNFTQRS
jgi:hypothetical protein